MTLPAYNPSAHENEQVLGRAGDRAYIDVVIEFPEGADAEEAAREAEMEALYQVRLARRRENEEREERRRERREARERGDYVALRALQERARAGSASGGVGNGAGNGGGRTVEELRAEHERIKTSRSRAVSSVSYADLGVARHDGTRLRANSNESEREGLLGGAASMAESTHNNNNHRRGRSGSSVLSVDTFASNSASTFDLGAGGGRSRGNSRAESPLPSLFLTETTTSQTPRRTSASGISTAGRERAGSSPEMVEHDDVISHHSRNSPDGDSFENERGDEFPPNSPPGYENIELETPGGPRSGDGVVQRRIGIEPPPDYSSPVFGRGEAGFWRDGEGGQGRAGGSRLSNVVTANANEGEQEGGSSSPEFISSPDEGVAGRGGQGETRREERERRRSSIHIGQLIDEERRTSAGSGGNGSSNGGGTGNGTTTTTPSLRVLTLPSIHVDGPSPVSGREGGEGGEGR